MNVDFRNVYVARMLLLLSLLAGALLSCRNAGQASHGADIQRVPLGVEVHDGLVTVTFTNNGSSAIGEPYLVFNCDYLIDGREATVHTVVATSCLGGCREIKPGRVADFDFLLDQLRFADSQQEPIAAGSHSVSITCPDTAAATLLVDFPPFADRRLWPGVEPSALNGITAYHNQVRAGVSPAPRPPLAPLIWSPDVATTAQAWADQCRFEHNSARGRLGENLAAFTNTSGSTAESVEQWASEAADFDYAANRCAPGKVCGHYTQMVWRGSEQLGCGMQNCTTGSPFPGFPNWQLFVCNYSPPGNVIGQRPYLCGRQICR